MILLFKKTRKNKARVMNEVIDTGERGLNEEFKSASQPTAVFFSPTKSSPTSCKYPLNIKELFPYWLRLTENGESLLISLTQKYYDWLTCNMTDVNSLSFFRLEDLIDLENIPDSLVQHLSNTYLNALSSDTIKDGLVSPEKIKNLIDNIRVNLYSRKGAEGGFRYLINELFDINPDAISISHPKRYVLRLNGGRFNWMRDNLATGANYSTSIDEFYPQLTGSILNYSVLQDNDLWQDYSYVLNTPDVTLEEYERVVRPILHPAGTKDFFQLRFDLFNDLKDSVSIEESETPILANYALYLLGSTVSIGHTFGCSGAYGGVTGSPIYTFPSWDQEISSKYVAGMSFGEININDFLYLRPNSGDPYPNSSLTC